jgi:hypothetical protein
MKDGMGRLALVVALVCSAAGSAAAQCCGDCNADGSVAINELITAVNNALSNCGAATATQVPENTPTPRPTATRTPNRCPFTLDQGRSGACGFRGRFNRGCGATLDSLLTSDGNTVIVTIDTMIEVSPVVQFAAQVTGETTASLTAWSSDGFQTIFTTAGDLQLTDDRSTLVIFPNDPPFMILSCFFVRYQGEYTGSTRAGARAGSDGAAALERLRAWRTRPVPELSVAP